MAQRIVDGDVPEALRGCRVMALDMGALVAGAKMRGDFEERVKVTPSLSLTLTLTLSLVLSLTLTKAVLNEVEAAGGEIVLFIDEIHTVGLGLTLSLALTPTQSPTPTPTPTLTLTSSSTRSTRSSA